MDFFALIFTEFLALFNPVVFLLWTFSSCDFGDNTKSWFSSYAPSSCNFFVGSSTSGYALYVGVLRVLH